MSALLDCQQCGACCATYRVSFYWAETSDAPGGLVPAELTQDISPHMRCMRGTYTKQPRCVALSGEIGQQVGCTIYAQRSSTCRELQAGTDQCIRARALHGVGAVAQAMPPIPLYGQPTPLD
jgi:Fe-S-cluster containining protein